MWNWNTIEWKKDVVDENSQLISAEKITTALEQDETYAETLAKNLDGKMHMLDKGTKDSILEGISSVENASEYPIPWLDALKNILHENNLYETYPEFDNIQVSTGSWLKPELNGDIVTLEIKGKKYDITEAMDAMEWYYLLPDAKNPSVRVENKEWTMYITELQEKNSDAWNTNKVPDWTQKKDIVTTQGDWDKVPWSDDNWNKTALDTPPWDKIPENADAHTFDNKLDDELDDEFSTIDPDQSDIPLDTGNDSETWTEDINEIQTSLDENKKLLAEKETKVLEERMKYLEMSTNTLTKENLLDNKSEALSKYTDEEIKIQKDKLTKAKEEKANIQNKITSLEEQKTALSNIEENTGDKIASPETQNESWEVITETIPEETPESSPEQKLEKQDMQADIETALFGGNILTWTPDERDNGPHEYIMKLNISEQTDENTQQLIKEYQDSYGANTETKTTPSSEIQENTSSSEELESVWERTDAKMIKSIKESINELDGKTSEDGLVFTKNNDNNIFIYDTEDKNAIEIWFDDSWSIISFFDEDALITKKGEKTKREGAIPENIIETNNDGDKLQIKIDDTLEYATEDKDTARFVNDAQENFTKIQESIDEILGSKDNPGATLDEDKNPTENKDKPSEVKEQKAKNLWSLENIKQEIKDKTNKILANEKEIKTLDPKTDKEKIDTLTTENNTLLKEKQELDKNLSTILENTYKDSSVKDLTTKIEEIQKSMLNNTAQVKLVTTDIEKEWLLKQNELLQSELNQITKIYDKKAWVENDKRINKNLWQLGLDEKQIESLESLVGKETLVALKDIIELFKGLFGFEGKETMSSEEVTETQEATVKKSKELLEKWSEFQKNLKLGKDLEFSWDSFTESDDIESVEGQASSLLWSNLKLLWYSWENIHEDLNAIWNVYKLDNEWNEVSLLGSLDSPRKELETWDKIPTSIFATMKDRKEEDLNSINYSQLDEGKRMGLAKAETRTNIADITKRARKKFKKYWLEDKNSQLTFKTLLNINKDHPDEVRDLMHKFYIKNAIAEKKYSVDFWYEHNLADPKSLLNKRARKREFDKVMNEKVQWRITEAAYPWSKTPLRDLSEANSLMTTLEITENTKETSEALIKVWNEFKEGGVTEKNKAEYIDKTIKALEIWWYKRPNSLKNKRRINKTLKENPQSNFTNLLWVKELED